jgi:four helix bundle protein
VGVIGLIERLRSGPTKRIVGDQLLRSATSIGANYREANRAESTRDFAHKLAIAEKEAAETQYWLEILRDTGLADEAAILPAIAEADEIIRIFNAARRTMRQNERR